MPTYKLLLCMSILVSYQTFYATSQPDGGLFGAFFGTLPRLLGLPGSGSNTLPGLLGFTGLPSFGQQDPGFSQDLYPDFPLPRDYKNFTCPDENEDDFLCTVDPCLAAMGSSPCTLDPRFRCRSNYCSAKFVYSGKLVDRPCAPYWFGPDGQYAEQCGGHDFLSEKGGFNDGQEGFYTRVNIRGTRNGNITCPKDDPRVRCLSDPCINSTTNRNPCFGEDQTVCIPFRCTFPVTLEARTFTYPCNPIFINSTTGLLIPMCNTAAGNFDCTKCDKVKRQPVCCGDVTYPNQCFVECTNTNQSTCIPGTCRKVRAVACGCKSVLDPICCKGRSYENKCIADCFKEDLNACRKYACSKNKPPLPVAAPAPVIVPEKLGSYEPKLKDKEDKLLIVPAEFVRIKSLGHVDPSLRSTLPVNTADGHSITAVPIMPIVGPQARQPVFPTDELGTGPTGRRLMDGGRAEDGSSIPRCASEPVSQHVPQLASENLFQHAYEQPSDSRAAAALPSRVGSSQVGRAGGVQEAGLPMTKLLPFSRTLIVEAIGLVQGSLQAFNASHAVSSPHHMTHERYLEGQVLQSTEPNVIFSVSQSTAGGSSMGTGQPSSVATPHNIVTRRQLLQVQDLSGRYKLITPDIFDQPSTALEAYREKIPSTLSKEDAQVARLDSGPVASNVDVRSSAGSLDTSGSSTTHQDAGMISNPAAAAGPAETMPSASQPHISTQQTLEGTVRTRVDGGASSSQQTGNAQHKLKDGSQGSNAIAEDLKTVKGEMLALQELKEFGPRPTQQQVDVAEIALREDLHRINRSGNVAGLAKERGLFVPSPPPPRRCTCTLEYKPICCVGRSYANPCFALCAGLRPEQCFPKPCVQVVDEGAQEICSCADIKAPVCCDSKEYNSQCFATCYNETTSDCAAGPCPNREHPASCGCKEDLDPVCCRGKTYQNKCYAKCFYENENLCSRGACQKVNAFAVGLDNLPSSDPSSPPPPPIAPAIFDAVQFVVPLNRAVGNNLPKGEQIGGSAPPISELPSIIPGLRPQAERPEPQMRTAAKSARRLRLPELPFPRFKLPNFCLRPGSKQCR